MIIQADNRGRIALSKIDTLIHNKMGVSKLPGSEWEVTYSNGALTVKPESEKPRSEWEKWGRLDPEFIGKVIYVDTESLPDSGLPLVREWKPSGIAGVLEWYRSGEYGNDVVEVKISGMDSIKFDTYGLFWVKTR